MMAKAEEANMFNTPISDNPIYRADSQRRSGWMGKSGQTGSARGSSRGGGAGRGRGRGFKKYTRGGRGGGKKRSFPKDSGSSTSYNSAAKKQATGSGSLPSSTFGPKPSSSSGLMSLPKMKPGVVSSKLKGF
jgi:hypothetical protein